MQFTGSKYICGLAVLKKYGHRYKLVVFKMAVASGWERNNDFVCFKRGEVNDEKLDNNIARARSKIFEYALCNDWQYFVTLTVDKQNYDRYNLAEYKAALCRFLNNYNSHNGCRIKYLLIPEPHKDGAWHMHGFMTGIPADKLQENAQGYLDWPAYSKKFGYISLGLVRNAEAAGCYITKYISKDLAARSMELNAHLYYSSKGLEKAETMKKGLMVGPISPDFENEYVKVSWFDSSDLSSALDMILD